VDIRWEPTFSPGRPQKLFDNTPYSDGANVRGYDFSLDGREFLMVKYVPGPATPVTEIILVQHWLDELNRLFHNTK
jgi:hypothetical protein